MEICTLASGSSGNALLVKSGSTYILIDAGISARRITTGLRALDVPPEQLSAILITHEHSDHISGLTNLTKKLRIPIYATDPTALQISYRVPFVDDLLHTFDAGSGFWLGDVWCETFPTPHDAAGSVGYALTADGCKMALCTDLGHVTREVIAGVAGADLLLAEANHDEDWVRSGPYPYYLKSRILGDRGHLSNEAGAELARLAAEEGARTVILAHLSQQNNTPAHARQASALCLQGAGIDPEHDLTLAVAPRAELGPVYRLERGQDVQVFHRKEAARG